MRPAHVAVHVEHLVLDAHSTLDEAAFRVAFAGALEAAVSGRGLRSELSATPTPVLDGGTLTVARDVGAVALGAAVAERVARTFTESPPGGADR